MLLLYCFGGFGYFDTEVNVQLVVQTQILVRPSLCGQGARCRVTQTQTHPGDDLEAGLLLVVDLQPRDDLPQEVCHLLGGPTLLLLGAPEGVVQVVGDLGEAAQRRDVRVLLQLLANGKGGTLALLVTSR